MSTPLEEFKKSAPLTLGVELELQLLSSRDFDLTRAATDLLGAIDYDGRFGEIKLEITESMIEVSTLARSSVDEISNDLTGLKNTLLDQSAKNNVVICGGGTHPFHRWPERRICPVERYDHTYERYGYLAKQFTVFGQHIHIGCESGDEAIWLTQALCPYVPMFIALSASSPYVDGVDTFFQSARLNSVSAFPLSGQCPDLKNWDDFIDYYRLLEACGIVGSIKDLYWDVRPKPEYGTVEIRVCDTPLTIERAAALAALAQCLVRMLLRDRPTVDTPLNLHVARFNKFQACRYGLDALISEPVGRKQIPLQDWILGLLEELAEDAAALHNTDRLNMLAEAVNAKSSDANWLRSQYALHNNLNDVASDAATLFRTSSANDPEKESR